jgi:hypothetical protein
MDSFENVLFDVGHVVEYRDLVMQLMEDTKPVSHDTIKKSKTTSIMAMAT